MPTGLFLELLALHPQAVPALCEWFEAEWPSYYGTGGPASALRDLQAYANQGSLPAGVVALRGSSVCGVAALKAESIASHAHLLPWAAAGFVHPSMRGQGIGQALLGALEEQARNWASITSTVGQATHKAFYGVAAGSSSRASFMRASLCVRSPSARRQINAIR